MASVPENVIINVIRVIYKKKFEILHKGIKHGALQWKGKHTALSELACYF